MNQVGRIGRIDRRRFLAAASSMAAASALTGCMRRVAGPLAPGMLPVDLPVDSCHLTPVRVSRDRVIRTVVGLRPYRPSGFRVEREQLGDTTVVHNYGHGGGGITLSWGTSKLALDLGAPGHVGPAAVLGSGVIGLTMARMLQDAGFAVTIYTKALPPNTTSNIAGGQWDPSAVYGDADQVSAKFTEQYLYACKFAYERYQILTDPRFGMRWMRNYQVQNEPFQQNREPKVPGGRVSADDATHELQPESRVLGPGENPFAGKYARQFDGMMIEPPMLLMALLTDYRIAGGKIVVGELKTRAEVQALPEKLVFNCTGLGAKALFDDADLRPLRGQLTFLVPQPEVTYATLYEDTYMFSRRDGVLLGGTHEEGNWSLAVDEATVTRKLAKQAELFASMRGCNVKV